MDIYCRKRACGEPWDAYRLRHHMAWRTCPHDTRVELWSDNTWHHADPHTYPRDTSACTSLLGPIHTIEPAHNGEVPDQVRAAYERGEPGWLNFVAGGHGCPACYGTGTAEEPDRTPTWTEADDLDTATEGARLDDLP